MLFYIHRTPNMYDRFLAIDYLRKHYVAPVRSRASERQYSISETSDTANDKPSDSAQSRISAEIRKDEESLLRVIRRNALFNESDMPDPLLGKSFVDRLLELIDRENLRDRDVYHAAGIDRKLFSKIRSNRLYHPSKDTAIALAVALRLPYAEAEDLITRAGYSLSNSSKRDVLIEFCLKARRFTLRDINDLLYELGEEIIRK